MLFIKLFEKLKSAKAELAGMPLGCCHCRSVFKKGAGTVAHHRTELAWVLVLMCVCALRENRVCGAPERSQTLRVANDNPSAPTNNTPGLEVLLVGSDIYQDTKL